MGRHIPWIDERIESFVSVYWSIDCRETGSSARARASARKQGIEGDVRQFLLDVIRRDAVAPNAWRDLCNVTVHSKEDVRRDATHFWEWLFDGAPLRSDGGGSGTLSPPQT